MAEQVYFSNDLLQVMSNAKVIAEEFDIKRATPLVIFYGILDLEVNPLYDYFKTVSLTANNFNCPEVHKWVWDGQMKYQKQVA